MGNAEGGDLTATRNTVQQRIIGEQLRALGNHPTVEEVYAAVREVRPSVSKATVYRVLQKMADTGDALRVPVAGGAEHFDHRADPHSHVVCMVCGHVDDIEASCLEGIDWNAVQSATGYVIAQQEMQFNGICPACAARAQEEGNPAATGKPSDNEG